MRLITTRASWQLVLGIAVTSVGSACSSPPPPRAAESTFLRASPIVERDLTNIVERDPVNTEGSAIVTEELAEPSRELAAAPPPSAPEAQPSTASAPKLRAPEAPGALIARANDLASQAPDPEGFTNAVMTYTYVPGGFYKVFAAPWYVTDIALEPGEELLGPVAGGDPTRWRLDVGTGAVDGIPQKHIFIKPLRPGLRTNLTLTTDRRVYLLDLESLEDTFMVAVRWTYPQDLASAPLATPTTSGTAAPTPAPTQLESLSFDYAIEVLKGKPSWTPRAVYDDGVHTYVRFARSLLSGEAPALYVIERGQMQLVNYRVKDTLYIVDRLFAVAELRLGADNQDVVRLRSRQRAPVAVRKPMRPRTP
jgi:type IV secretion system protein TrbG